MNCLFCGKETKNPKYCGRSCSAKASNKTPKRTRKIWYCQNCNKEAEYSRKFCKECGCYTKIEDYDCKTLKDVRYNSGHKSNANSFVRALARRKFKDIKSSCQNCNYSLHIEVCHIKQVASFLDTDLVGEVNSRENVVFLCPNCHWEFDNGYLSLSDFNND